MDRVLFPCKSLREKLARYSRGGSESEFLQLEEEVERKASFLSPLLTMFRNEGHLQQAPQAYRCLLTELSKSSPTCALLHPCPDLDSLLEHLFEGKGGDIRHDSALMHKVHHHCPLLWQVLCADGLKEGILPLLRQMYTVAKQAFISEGGPHATDNGGDMTPSPLDFFPHLPIKRPRGRYLQDQGKKEVGKEDCKKEGGQHTTLIPGIFTMFCGHGE